MRGKQLRLFKGLVLGIAVYLVVNRVFQRVRGLGTRRYPKFIYSNVKVEELGIPVFTYHSIAGPNTPDSITPTEFERHMRYLADNGYHTLTADELYDYLVNGSPVPSKSVLITFDDGRATLWTVAYPILKKYGLKATTFIVPATMTESGVRSTLADYEAGYSVSQTQIINADLSDTPTITWDEAKIMFTSGLIDFQSHTLDHTLIYFTSDIVDFINPDFEFGYGNFCVPITRYNGADCVSRKPRLGTPVYRYQPRMGAAKRFFDDESLRSACANYVEQRGGESFFAQKDWRLRLFRFVEAYRQNNSLQETFETTEEQIQAIHYSLAQSKQIIEGYLPGHNVRHLCYPWHRYSALATYLAREAGYVTNFIDINHQKPSPAWNDPYVVQRLLPVNEYGDDPYQITRIDAGYNTILSLPGRERLTYTQRLGSQLFRLPKLFRG